MKLEVDNKKAPHPTWTVRSVERYQNNPIKGYLCPYFITDKEINTWQLLGNEVKSGTIG